MTPKAAMHLENILRRAWKSGKSLSLTFRKLAVAGIIDASDKVAVDVLERTLAQPPAMPERRRPRIRNPHIASRLARVQPMSRFQMEPPTSED